jgi:hypothetical protein
VCPLLSGWLAASPYRRQYTLFSLLVYHVCYSSCLQVTPSGAQTHSHAIPPGCCVGAGCSASGSWRGGPDSGAIWGRPHDAWHGRTGSACLLPVVGCKASCQGRMPLSIASKHKSAHLTLAMPSCTLHVHASRLCVSCLSRCASSRSIVFDMSIRKYLDSLIMLLQAE